MKTTKQAEKHIVENNLMVLPIKNGFAIFCEVNENNGDSYFSNSSNYQMIESRVYGTREEAEQVLREETCQVNPDLASYYGDRAKENQNYSVSLPKVREFHGGPEDVSYYVIASIGEHYNDDGPNNTWVESIDSVEHWGNEEEAQEALDNKDFTLLRTFKFQPYHFNREEIQVIANYGKFDVARPILMHISSSHKDYADLDYAEVIARGLNTKEEAQQVLDDYIKENYGGM